jgi:hypothetical protein
MGKRDTNDGCEIDIHVVDAKGKPVRQEKVYVNWGWHGAENKRTNDVGHVSFWIPYSVLSGNSDNHVEFSVGGKNFEYDDVKCGNGYKVTIQD